MSIIDSIKNLGKDEITRQLDNARTYLKPRLDRIKDDLDKRYFLQQYIFTDLNKKQHKGINNVTLNDSRLYADAMIRILGTAKRRLEISGAEEEVNDSAEKFLDWLFTRADETLVYQNQETSEAAHNFTTCVEGAADGRVILYHDPKTDLWLPEIIPLDPYSVIYVQGVKGCRIASIESTMPADEIFVRYGYTVSGKTAKVQDIYTVDQEIIKVNGSTVGEPKTHNMGMNFVIVVGCPTAPFLTALSVEDAVKYQYESIFGGVRDMYETANREGTGWSTQNWMGFMPPVVGVMKSGRVLPKLPEGFGTQISLEEGESVGSWPIRDVGQACQAWFGQVSMRIQEATFSNIQHGQLPFELSAVAIKELTAKGDQHFVPRLMAKRTFRIMAGYNLIQQFVMGGYQTDLQGQGFKITDWKPEDFKDKNFVINCDYWAESPEESIANMTIANTAMALGLPPEWIYKNILHIGDVPEVMRARARDMAIKLSSPAAELYCGEMLKDSPNDIDNKLAEVIKESAGSADGEVSNPPSQPAPATGLQLMPKGSPAREQMRRRNIKAPEGG